jgi:phosphate transport system substrate-binding protein
MMIMKLKIVVLSVFFATCCISCSNVKTEISGAGATFPLSYYNMVFKDFSDTTGINVAYGGIGSGGGIRSLKDGIVDFAATDAFLSKAEEAEIAKSVIHVPTCLGAVVVAYNVPEISSLRLSADVLADIFLGVITKWNDGRIVETNPDIVLPDLNITVIYRSDGSGTTNVFTDYLSKISDRWRAEIGAAKSVSFPVGVAAKGNPGVAGIIGQTAGAIGYVGSEYAFARKIAFASLQNKAGKFVKPSTASISAAASANIPADSKIMITNSAAEEAYPISCFTWIVIYREQNYAKRSPEQAQATVKLLNFILSNEAQSKAANVHYAPLPENVRCNALKSLKSVTYNGKAIE